MSHVVNHFEHRVFFPGLMQYMNLQINNIFLRGQLGEWWDPALLILCCFPIPAETPQVQVYSRNPAEKGKENTLNCYVDKFHPPKINITLEKNGQRIENMQVSDLSFADDWTFQLLVHAPVTPNGKDEYTCRVEHVTLGKPRVVKWGECFAALCLSSFFFPSPYLLFLETWKMTNQMWAYTSKQCCCFWFYLSELYSDISNTVVGE